VETNNLIHSKMKGGMGKCESASERATVIDAIDAFLYPTSNKKD